MRGYDQRLPTNKKSPPRRIEPVLKLSSLSRLMALNANARATTSLIAQCLVYHSAPLNAAPKTNQPICQLVNRKLPKTERPFVTDIRYLGVFDHRARPRKARVKETNIRVMPAVPRAAKYPDKRRLMIRLSRYLNKMNKPKRTPDPLRAR